MTEMVGKCVWTTEGTKRVMSVRYMSKPIEYRNAISFHHMNIITNGILTSTGFNNLYPIKDMKYIKTDRPLRTEDEFELDRRWYQGLRLYEHYTNPSEARNCNAISWGGDKWLIA